jgi:hypothetical protein
MSSNSRIADDMAPVMDYDSWRRQQIEGQVEERMEAQEEIRLLRHYIRHINATLDGLPGSLKPIQEREDWLIEDQVRVWRDCVETRFPGILGDEGF